MIAFFKDKSSGGVFWLVLLSIALHAHFIADPPQVITSPADGFIYHLLKWLPDVPSVGLMLLYQLLIITQALLLNYLCNNLRLFQRQGFLVAMSYIAITALLPEWNNITPSLITNSLIIGVFSMVSRFYGHQKSKGIIYNCGLLASATALLYVNAFPLILFCFLSIAVLRSFKANEWFVLLLGVITPYYFVFSALFLSNNWALVSNYLPSFQLHLIWELPHILGIALAIVLLIILLLLGSVFASRNVGRMLLHARRVWVTIFILLALFIPICFVVRNGLLDILLMPTVPAAVIITNFFLYPKSRLLTNILFWLVVATVVFINFTWIIVRA